MKKLVALTGSGISAESGMQTFRFSNQSYWNNNNIADVATPAAWEQNRELVTKFYNERRAQLSLVQPNTAHKFLVELEEIYDICVITQNVDDLHERAGSNNVIHVHGELTKARNEETGDVVSIGYEPMNSEKPYRPHVVWFGESPLNYTDAAAVMRDADIVLVIGTSLYVSTATALLRNIRSVAGLYIIDPAEDPLTRRVELAPGVESYLCGELGRRKHVFIQKTAVDSVADLRVYLSYPI